MSLFFRADPGPRLAALLEAQKPIAALYEPWVQGEVIDRQMLRRLHDTASVAAHAYYIESIPIYRQLAEDLGLTDCDDAGMIRACAKTRENSPAARFLYPKFGGQSSLIEPLLAA